MWPGCSAAPVQKQWDGKHCSQIHSLSQFPFQSLLQWAQCIILEQKVVYITPEQLLIPSSTLESSGQVIVQGAAWHNNKCIYYFWAPFCPGANMLPCLVSLRRWEGNPAQSWLCFCCVLCVWTWMLAATEQNPSFQYSCLALGPACFGKGRALSDGMCMQHPEPRVDQLSLSWSRGSGPEPDQGFLSTRGSLGLGGEGEELGEDDWADTKPFVIFSNNLIIESLGGF